METRLRPLSLGEILDRTAQLYRTNFVLFAGIAAVYAGVMLVLNLLQIGLAELLRALHLTHQLQWVSLAYVILILPLAFIFAGAAMAANNRAVAWVNLGQTATIRGAYKSILPRLGRYLWLMTIATFVIYLPFALLYGGYFLLIFFYARPKGSLPTPAPRPTPRPRSSSPSPRLSCSCFPSPPSPTPSLWPCVIPWPFPPPWWKTSRPARRFAAAWS